MACVFVAAVLAALLAGWSAAGGREAPGAAALAGLVAAALAAASPMARLFASLVMLELPGVLFLFLAVAAYTAALRRPENGRFHLAFLAATALFFVKYNYGLLWLAPLVLHEAWIGSGSLAALARRIRAATAGADLLRPWPLFLIAYGVFLLAYAWRGGFTLRLFGGELRGTSLGNPVYALYLLAATRAGVRAWRDRGALGRRWAALAPRRRALLSCTAAPIALWMLLPQHAKELVDFVTNRSSAMPAFGAESLGFYPRSFLDDFSAAPVVGWLALGLALAPLARLGRLAPPRRVVVLALALSLLLTAAHPYKQPRFLFIGAALLWLSAALTAADSWRTLARRLPAAANAVAAGAGALALVAAATLPAGDRLATDFRRHSVDGSVLPMLDALADGCAEAPACAVAGVWNDLSPALLEWHLRLRHGRPEGDRRPRDVRRLAGGPRPAVALERAAALPPGARVQVVDLEPGGRAWSHAFRRETDWLAPLRAAIADHPAFELEAEATFPESGYRLWTYRRPRSAAVSSARALLAMSGRQAIRSSLTSLAEQ
jgi:hypothetical protein